MAIDPNVFNNIKQFADYNRADQAFQLQKATQEQALQSGGIDAASKANVYATQVLSAATATGDQGAYDQAKQTLQQNGVDTSTWAPDVATGAQQAQAARLAQSPYGTIFNAQQKVIANNIAGAGVMGTTNNSFTQPVPSLNPVNGQISITPQIAQQAPAQASSAPAPQGQTPSAAMVGNNAVMAPADKAAATQDVFNPTPAAPVNLPGASDQRAAPVQAPNFSFRAQVPGETLAAYKDAQQQAFEQYKASPQYLQTAAIAGDTGKAISDANVNAIKSDESAKRLQPNFDNLRSVNNDVPDNSYGIPASIKAYASSTGITGDGGKAAEALDQWKMVNEQQTLTALGQLVSGGQIKSNRQIVKMLETGNFVPENLQPAERLKLIDVLENESKNQATSAGNIAARLQGGEAQPYVSTSPQSATPSGLPPGSVQYGTSGGVPVYKTPDGKFLKQQ